MDVSPKGERYSGCRPLVAAAAALELYMVLRPPLFDPQAPVIVMDIGNTTLTVATWQGGQLKTPLSTPTDDDAALEEALTAHLDALPRKRPAATVIA